MCENFLEGEREKQSERERSVLWGRDRAVLCVNPEDLLVGECVTSVYNGKRSVCTV